MPRTDGEIRESLARLSGRSTALGCAAMEELLEESRASDRVYPYLGELMALLEADSSYTRTRALLLIAANARWDGEGLIDGNLQRILEHITDPKPITSRQFIAALPELARYKPELRGELVRALEEADTGGYADSMRPLVDRDILRALALLRE